MIVIATDLGAGDGVRAVVEVVAGHRDDLGGGAVGHLPATEDVGFVGVTGEEPERRHQSFTERPLAVGFAAAEVGDVADPRRIDRRGVEGHEGRLLDLHLDSREAGEGARSQLPGHLEAAGAVEVGTAHGDAEDQRTERGALGHAEHRHLRPVGFGAAEPDGGVAHPGDRRARHPQDGGAGSESAAAPGAMLTSEVAPSM
ncbi:MAG: hypothetical protein ACE5GB_09265, partial [Acidimicrobiales bacterium]